MSRRLRTDQGQATVELALLVPFVLLLVLTVAQVALVWRADVLVHQAAREGARVAAVSPDGAVATRAATEATSLDEGRLDVIISRGPPGGVVEVTVRHRMSGALPLVGVGVEI